MKLANLLCAKFPNLEDRVEISNQTRTSMHLSQLKTVTVRQCLSKAKRNRNRRQVQRPVLNPRERLMDFSILGKVEKNTLMRNTLSERSDNRSLPTTEFLTMRPYLRTYEGVVCELRILKNVTNIDKNILRIKRCLGT